MKKNTRRNVQAPMGLADKGDVFGQFENVGKKFLVNSPHPIVALEDVSLTLNQGEIVSLLGPSGCGKTTFLRIVAGLETPTTGQLRLGGIPVSGPHADVAFVFQQPNLMPWRTVLKNVLFPLEIRGELTSVSTDRARELLELVGLGGFEDRYPSELSGGMQQRVALCRALVHDAKLLLMDEPFAALDELTRMEMHDLLLDIKDRANFSVLFVTHSISEAIYLSDQVAVFSRRPATICDLIEVELERPRHSEMRYEAQFIEYGHRASKSLGIVR